ncbi:Nitrogen regulation protein NR(I) [hydrothermal vent metagenome]|uniref:Nitrogen regulation protein NR(I) n=1 Tax=hydrothermal vent metagenome TaxID=652676 RepID=A0A3B1BK53_9ZZZZ
MTSALIVDIDRRSSETLRSMLESASISVRAVYDPAELTDINTDSGFALVLVSPSFVGTSGMDVLDYLRSVVPDARLAVILDSKDDGEEENYRRRGAEFALIKPFSQKSVDDLLKMALAPKVGDEDAGFMGMIGKSPVMTSLFDTIRSLAETDASVLIHGQTGVGKELIASAIHHLSRRKQKKLVTINCGALSESLLESELFGHERGAFTGAFRAKAGKFEYGNGGTVFLDEIGEISHDVQIRLLKVIESGEVERLGSNHVIKTDTRMIFATNRDLAEDVKNGRFRKDLYYRINVIPVRAPSLTERKEDIPALAEHFMRTYAARYEREVTIIAPSAMEWLIKQKWEGNVRELENVIERGVVVAASNTLTLENLDPASERADGGEVGSISGVTYKEMVGQVMSVYEKRYFIRLLEDCGGNVSKAARKAELDRKTLYGRLTDYGIDPSLFRKKPNA